MDAQTLISDKNITSEIEKCILFAFAETQMNEMGYRFHRLAGESNERLSEASVLKKQVSDLTIRLENMNVQLSTVSEERDQMKEKVEKMFEEKLEKEIMIVELKKERDLAVKDSKELQKVINDLKEKIDAVNDLRETNWNKSKMVEDDSIICKADWSNLPHDLLSQIANTLGPFGYLSLCLVCKNWRNATLEASREHKFSRYDPCYLLYGGESSQCTLLSNTDNIYTIDIPELDGATCLVSYEGWLLVFHDGSLFFFCPFSKAKIELPNCPFKELTKHIAAAFSSPPTSQDCIVVVLREKFLGLDMHMLCRGDSIWVELKDHPFYHWQHDHPTGVVSLEAEFIFDGANSKQSNTFRFPKQSSHKIDYPIIPSKDVRRKLGLNAVSISTCGSGTLHLFSRNEVPLVVIKSDYLIDSFRRSTRFKGVWILPRYHHIPADQSW